MTINKIIDNIKERREKNNKEKFNKYKNFIKELDEKEQAISLQITEAEKDLTTTTQQQEKGEEIQTEVHDEIAKTQREYYLREQMKAICDKLKITLPKNKEHMKNYNMRNLIKPGISGWSQVSYPYGASVNDAEIKLSFDIYYIRNFSLLFDFLIFFKTIRLVLRLENSQPRMKS